MPRNLHPIDSLDDERLTPYRDLKDRELAAMVDQPGDGATGRGGLFIVQGEHLVRRMLASGFQIHSLLVSEKRVSRIADEVPAEVPVYTVHETLMTQVIGFKFHSGILACAWRGRAATLDEVVADSLNPINPAPPLTLLVCPEVMNHENLGALMRVATALGVEALVLGQQSCDPFWRRSVRVSMGTIFSLPIVRSADIDADLLRLRDEFAFDLVAAVTDDGAQPLSQAQRGPRLAVVIGCEAQGLDPRHVALCQRRVTIPMQRGTDSLNIASATAVFLYHFTQVTPPL